MMSLLDDKRCRFFVKKYLFWKTAKMQKLELFLIFFQLYCLPLFCSYFYFDIIFCTPEVFLLAKTD